MSKILYLFGFTILLSSCSLTSKLGEGELYLQENRYSFEGKSSSLGLNDYVTQKPNVRTLGIFPMKDWMYNFSPQELDSTFEEYYSFDKSKRNQPLLDSLYLKNGLENSVGKSYFFSRTFYKWGAPPIVLDTTKSYASARNLKNLFFDHGYFDAKVSPSFKIDSAAKKARVTYQIELNEPSTIASYNQSIAQTELEEIYENNVRKSIIKTGMRYEVEKFKKEKERLTTLYKNNGFYKFNELNNELIFKIDSTQSKELNVALKIAKSEEDSVKTFHKYTFGKVVIYPNNTSENITNETSHLGYEIKSNRAFKFRPRVFTDAITIAEGDLYKQSTIDETRKLIYDRENFMLNAIELKEKQDSILDVNIFIKPKPKYNLELSFDGMYSPYLNFGVSPGIKWLSRNVFNNGENLQLSLKGTVGTVNSDDDNHHFFNAYELYFNTELSFPRWLLPWNTEGLLPKRYNPSSSLGFGLSGQKNIGLGSRNYQVYLNYKFSPGISDVTIEAINFQYIRNKDKDKYYTIFTLDNSIKESAFEAYFQYDTSAETDYDNGTITESELENTIYFDSGFINALPIGDYTFSDYTSYRNMIFRKESTIQDVVIQPIALAWKYNEKKINGKQNPWNIYSRVAVSGALLRLVDTFADLKEETDFLGERYSLIGGVRYSEYARLDLDVRKYFQLSPKTTLALRGLFGIAVPYGNSSSIPFVKSYFAGGSNDVRAWTAYELSPNPLSPDDSGTYIGNMKITWSAEYRFPLTQVLNGAVFTDAGNIWSVNDQNNLNEFKFNEFYKQLGIGSGFGLRYDLTYLILRLDFAYKIHNPAYDEGQRWFRNINLLKPQIQFGINYPF